MFKWVKAQALPINDARTVFRFHKRVFTQFGTPKIIISDRGTDFYNTHLEKMFKHYRVHQRLATTYHPQTSGQVEATNSKLKRILTKFVEHRKKDWSEYLDDTL